MLEVILKTGAMIRQHCLICCGNTNKDMVQARVYEDNEDTHLVVCEKCLALSPTERAAQLHQKAESRRESADATDKLADELPPMPSRAEWTAANAAAEDEYVSCLSPEERAQLGPSSYLIGSDETRSV